VTDRTERSEGREDTTKAKTVTDRTGHRSRSGRTSGTGRTEGHKGTTKARMR
jgi:hypothetical protein